MTENIANNEIINHLLFHKSLIDERDDAARINYYADLLEKTQEGEFISIADSFDRSIAIAFELVIQQHLDPWDLDLVEFSSMYLERAKKEHIDLITAGRIIYMAWKILRLQSDHLVVSLEQQEQEEQDMSWEDFPTEMWLTADDEYTYTNLLMTLPEAPLNEPIRRQSTRKVTLIELLDAFNHARKESEEYQRIDQQRRKERHRMWVASRNRMKGTAHEDNLEEDIRLVWERIQQMGAQQISITDLCDVSNKEELIKTLISVLFLAYEKKIYVFQKKFPYGKIFIKTLGCT